MIILGSVTAPDMSVSLLDGSIFEFITRPSLVSLALWGVSNTNILSTRIWRFSVGHRDVVRDAVIFTNFRTLDGVVDQGPKFPDFFAVVDYPCFSGERLTLYAATPGGVAWALIITEVG